MDKIERGLSGKVARILPILTERAVGLVEGVEKKDGNEVVVIYVNDGGGSHCSKVLRQDIDKLNLGSGDGVDIRRLCLGDPSRPADYIEKKEQAVKRRKLIRATTRI